MTIKDKLAHYEPKPLGEKRRYAVLLPLIYDVKTDKYQILYQVRSEHISQPVRSLFLVAVSKMVRLFKKLLYEKHVRN